MDKRLRQLTEWAREFTKARGYLIGSGELVPVSEDASFRRYFRLQGSDSGCVFVDAPPAKEDLKSFIAITALLDQGKVSIGKVRGQDLKLGFLAIDDLGDRLLLAELKAHKQQASSRLHQAGLEILKMQQISSNLPLYSRQLLEDEMQLFPEWFLENKLEFELTREWRDLYSRLVDLMIENALSQPQAFVHRDFHSRNIMLTAGNGMAVIDYQDAVIGPLTYDLVSLLKDCYFRVNRSEVVTLVEANWDLLRHRHPNELKSFPEFLRWFDLMGLQRHLKCAGIFCRLQLRDGKSGYLADVPLVFEYILEVCDLYDGLAQFGRFLRTSISPLMKEKFV